MTAEPEPNGWELMRAFNSLRASIDNLAAGMVTQAAFGLYQQAAKDSEARQDARIKQLEQDAAEARKTKASQWFAIVVVGLGSVGSIVSALVVASLRGGVG